MKSNPLLLVCVLMLSIGPSSAPAATTITSSGSAGVIVLPLRPVRLNDGSWDQRFNLPPGLNGEVLCATFFRGDLYIGGRFTRAGGIIVKGLARWDGIYWWPVSDGIEGTVMALTVHGNSLYVGGQFRTLGPLNATNIVRFTRHGWEPLGDGIPFQDLNGRDQAVTSVAARGRDVFVGGVFNVAGGRGARNVAQWDGRRWLALDEGIGRVLETGAVFGQVNALAMIGRNLYAGGLFDRAGTGWATNIARWNGDRWKPLGEGVSGGETGIYLGGGVHSGVVCTLAVKDGRLLAGGDFTAAGSRHATNVARWSGQRWSSYAGGAQGGAVRDILVHGPEVFIAGSFTQAGGVQATNVARWNGRRWTALEEGVRGFGNALALRGKDLFVGGYFGLAGREPAAFIARWRRGEWFALRPDFIPGVPIGVFPGTIPTAITNALIGELRAVAADGNDIYVGGTIYSAGLVPVNNIAHWNGTQWSALGGGIPGGSIQQISADGTNVYVSGSFTLPEAGATNLARWDGQRWASVGGGLSYADFTGTNFHPASINAIQASRGKLYVAGGFTRGGAVELNGLACWDGTNWSPCQSASAPSDDPPTYTPISLFAVGADKVYAQGSFTSIGGTNASNIAQWDDLNWSPLGDGLFIDGANPASYPRALAARGSNDLYFVGDQLTTNSAASPTNLLHWDGSAWSAPGVPTAGDAALLALAASPTRLFIGGYFTNVAGQTAGHVVRWDGSNFTTMAGGVSGGGQTAYVSGLAQGSNKVCVIGRFGEAGGAAAFNFAVWNDNALSFGSPGFPPIIPFPGPIFTNIFLTNIPPREIRTNPVILIALTNAADTNLWTPVLVTNLPPAIQLNPAKIPDADSGAAGAAIKR